MYSVTSVIDNFSQEEFTERSVICILMLLTVMALTWCNNHIMTMNIKYASYYLKPHQVNLFHLMHSYSRYSCTFVTCVKAFWCQAYQLGFRVAYSIFSWISEKYLHAHQVFWEKLLGFCIFRCRFSERTVQRTPNTKLHLTKTILCTVKLLIEAPAPGFY